MENKETPLPRTKREALDMISNAEMLSLALAHCLIYKFNLRGAEVDLVRSKTVDFARIAS